MQIGKFHSHGHITFPASAETLRWVDAVRPQALAAMDDPALQHWWRCGHTWFVGVDALANDAQGRVEGGPALAGAAVDFTGAQFNHAHPASHRGQISVCLPGYPQRGPEESEAAHAFRARRDAAHVDGLHGEGEPKRRFMRERHDFILGLALEDGDAGASPLSVWEGSHAIMQAALREAYRGLPPQAWPDRDVTEIYTAARAQVFESCRRVELPLRKGEAVLVHRFTLHGVAAWRASPLPRRAIIYFRPCIWDAERWLAEE
ncbi:MAG: hypothetical protein KGO53_15615 [Alphaproteobacteria bacterium]|nr:hypothetical protein [Alphaproteobacteria bacterium]